MSGLRVHANAVANTGTVLKTIVQVVAASNHAAKLKEWSVSFQGSSPSGTPVKVEVLRQTTAGTSSSLTLTKDPNDAGETIQTTGLQTFSAEPTAGDVLFTEYVHPQLGYTWQAQFGEEKKIQGGGRLGIRVTSAADISCSARLIVDE